MAKSKVRLKTSTIVIAIVVCFFVTILAAVFVAAYFLGQKTSTNANQALQQASRGGGAEDQQIRKIRFVDQKTGESMEIYMDGTVNYYDKNGKLIKTGRRGFAETQQIFTRFEYLINNKKKIEGSNYYIEIETEEGTIIINPGGGGSGSGGDEIDDAIDFIDRAVNPTPRPSPTPTPSGYTLPTPNPTPTPMPTPYPSAPDYLTAPPFRCEDYYKSGKFLKISNIFCGPTPVPTPGN